MKSITQLTKLLHAQKRLFMILLAALSQATFAQENGYWDDRFGPPNYLYDYVSAIAVIDSGIYIGGSFTDHKSVAMWDGKGWSALGTGVIPPPGKSDYGSVLALALLGNDLYAGGSFSWAGNLPANKIAKWNLITKKWSTVESNGVNGVNGTVWALAAHGNKLYVGGYFTVAGGAPAKGIAVWDDSLKTWTPLGQGVEGSVRAIAVSGRNLYVGGSFTSAGGKPASNIAKWDGKEWFALGNGVDRQANAIAILNGDLYVGGYFTKAGNLNTNCIAKWSMIDKSWSALSSGTKNGVFNSGGIANVYALAANGHAIYVGGTFSQAGAQNANYIAKWDPSTNSWSPLGSGVNGQVFAIATHCNDVFVGGGFSVTGGGVTGNKRADRFGIWHEIPASPNRAPAWSNLPPVSFPEDRAATSKLNRFVSDEDHALAELTFSAEVIGFTNNANGAVNENPALSAAAARNVLKITIDPISSIATFMAKEDSHGIFTAVFKVVDPCGLSDSDTIRVTVTPVNDPPVLAALLELRFDEDKALLYSIRNWYPFVTDIDHADSTLAFNVISAKNVKAARQAGNFRFSAPANWFGKDTLQVIVKDPGQLADTTALMVTVNPVNDAPKISGLPDSLSFKKGASAQLKIWDFVEDMETPDSLLTYGFSASNPSLRLSFNPALRGMLTLTAPQFHGRAKLFVNISDGKASARDTINVTVILVNDPPVISAVPELRFDEDKSLLYPIHNWYPFATDKDHADSTLTFAAQAGKNVKAARQAGDFRFSAPANWFGKDTLQLIVTDSGNLAGTAALMVTVNPVNDAPTITSLPDSLVFPKGGSAQLKLWDYVEDVETPNRQLTYTFSTSNPSLLRNFDYTTGVLVLTAPQFHGRAQLFINVSDSKASAQDTMAVRVELPTGVTSFEPALPTAFQLWPNSPNPFPASGTLGNPGTTIRFDTPSAGRVKLAVYTLRGELVQTLVDSEMAAGAHQFHFDGRNLASGIYFYRMETDSYVMTRKMLLQK